MNNSLAPNHHKNSTGRFTFKTWLFLLIGIAFYSQAMADTGYASQHCWQDSIVIKRNFNLKNHTRLQHTNRFENMLILFPGNNWKNCQLFLFDMSGKLVKRTNISETEKALAGVDKGNYFFEIFNADERIENGSIIVK